MGEADDRETWKRTLEPLAADPVTAELRTRVCSLAAASLAQLGNLLWMSGSLIGSGRVDGTTKFGFGDDRAVGVATVAQIGGELGAGAIDLLRARNRYATQALARQLVEVEYLAYHFAEEDGDSGEVAAEWLQADRQQRLTFWQPRHLRARANGRFPTSDYQHHCDLGGHPTMRAMALLPNHSTAIREPYVWVDLAGHLTQIWGYLVSAADKLPFGAVLGSDEREKVAAEIAEWRERDDLFRAIQTLGAIRGLDETDA